MPLVTIVTITFNLIKAGREKTFRQCLESVHNGTYKNVEHIVIDGASKDGTLDLIKEYANKGWVKYISEPDSGIYDAMNKGVRMAKGKYITFLNSDDFYHNKEGIEKSVNALEESGADFSYAPAVIMKEDGSSSAKHPHVAPDISSVFFTMPFCHQTMLVGRDVMIKEEMFDINFKSAGDYDFVIRLCLKKYKSVFVNNVFVTYRLGGLSNTNQEQSRREVAEAYFKNYNKLVPIKKVTCEKIYGNGYGHIPSKLAQKLEGHEPYFNYTEYVTQNKLSNKLKTSYNAIYNKFLCLFSSNRLSGLPQKIIQFLHSHSK